MKTEDIIHIKDILSCSLETLRTKENMLLPNCKYMFIFVIMTSAFTQIYPFFSHSRFANPRPILKYVYRHLTLYTSVRVVVLPVPGLLKSFTTTGAGCIGWRIDSLESIPGLLKCLEIRALWEGERVWPRVAISPPPADLCSGPSNTSPNPSPSPIPSPPPHPSSPPPHPLPLAHPSRVFLHYFVASLLSFTRKCR
jgi:hypothetical protein